MTSCIEVEIDKGMAQLILCRPQKRNSMIPAFWQQLPDTIRQVQADGTVRVIVIRSTGPHFSSGMDLSVLAGSTSGNDSAGSAASETRSSDSAKPGTSDHGVTDGNSFPRHAQRAMRLHDLILRLQASFTALEQARIPVIAAVQGGCIGAALDMICACDMRFATRDARFIIQETNLAMTADVGTFPRLCKLIPDGLVRELAYTGRALSADEALQSGLVNRLFDDQDAMQQDVLQTAALIAEKAPMAVHGCKRMILHARDHSVSDTLEHVSLWNAAFFEQQQVAEAMLAQRQERPANHVPLPALSDSKDDFELP